MRTITFVFTTLVAAAVATVTISASDKSPSGADLKKAPLASSKLGPEPTQLATMKGIKATPMPSKELEAVKGQHVHFLDANGGFHLAGDVKHENNWKNLGGTDGNPVAPSYKGLCVAHGAGGIFIPTFGPITTECP